MQYQAYNNFRILSAAEKKYFTFRHGYLWEKIIAK